MMVVVDSHHLLEEPLAPRFESWDDGWCAMVLVVVCEVTLVLMAAGWDMVVVVVVVEVLEQYLLSSIEILSP